MTEEELKQELRKERDAKEKLENELALSNALNKERDVSDKKYAIKLVETVVFVMVGTILLGFLGAIITYFIHAGGQG